MVSVTVFQIFKNKRLFIHAGLRRLFKSTYPKFRKPLILLSQRLFCCRFAPSVLHKGASHMAGQFLVKSRHGTIYYFRRRVPAAAQHVIGRRVLVQSLETSDRRMAIIRGRALAAKTDAIFQRITMTKKSSRADDLRIDYTLKIDLNEFGFPSSITVDAQPEEQEAVNSAIRTALAASGGHGDQGRPPKGAQILQQT
jgi:hypothetical protein